MPDIVQVILSLVGVFGLLFLFLWLLRKVKGTTSVRGQSLRVLERMAVGKDAWIAVISVDGRRMLIGTTQNGMTKLCDLDDEDVETGETVETVKTSGQASFGRTFADALRSSVGLKPKHGGTRFDGGNAAVTQKTGQKPLLAPDEADESEQKPLLVPDEADEPEQKPLLAPDEADEAYVPRDETSGKGGGDE
jgi:flagellar biogenesis protein FliO